MIEEDFRECELIVLTVFFLDTLSDVFRYQKNHPTEKTVLLFSPMCSQNVHRVSGFSQAPFDPIIE